MSDVDVDIDAGAHSLAATLTNPTGNSAIAAVLMIAGSGPVDRNENLPSFSLNIFNTLASELCQARVASVRYDKRGCGASGGDYITAGHNDFVQDASCAARFVQQHPKLAHLPLFILGHSEGCAIAPQVAKNLAEQPPTGLILLCPFTQPMRDILVQQASNLQQELMRSRGIMGFINRGFVRLRGGIPKMQGKFLKRIDSSTGDTINVGKATINAKWWREIFALDARAILRSITIPTFALGAGKDLQCDPKDTTELHELIHEALLSTHIEENLTHILRCDAGEHSMKSRYPVLAKEPIEPMVAERCLAFINSVLATK